ncbi:hypothetical protein [Apibacter mensalis]|nr:hypothetical protein [Apibacter mensalis]
MGEFAGISTKGDSSHGVAMGECADIGTYGKNSHGVTTGKRATNFTEGENSHSITMGTYADSITEGKNSVSCALGYGSIASAQKGFIVIAEYEEDKKTIKKIHAVKVGEKILGVVIDVDESYGFDENGFFRKI